MKNSLVQLLALFLCCINLHLEYCHLVLLQMEFYSLLNFHKPLYQAFVPYYFVFNGGGDITATNHTIVLEFINLKSITKVNKKGKEEKNFTKKITINENTIVKPIKINFFGEMSYEEFKKN